MCLNAYGLQIDVVYKSHFFSYIATGRKQPSLQFKWYQIVIYTI